MSEKILSKATISFFTHSTYGHNVIIKWQPYIPLLPLHSNRSKGSGSKRNGVGGASLTKNKAVGQPVPVKTDVKLGHRQPMFVGTIPVKTHVKPGHRPTDNKCVFHLSSISWSSIIITICHHHHHFSLEPPRRKKYTKATPLKSTAPVLYTSCLLIRCKLRCWYIHQPSPLSTTYQVTLCCSSTLPTVGTTRYPLSAQHATHCRHNSPPARLFLSPDAEPPCAGPHWPSPRSLLQVANGFFHSLVAKNWKVLYQLRFGLNLDPAFQISKLFDYLSA